MSRRCMSRTCRVRDVSGTGRPAEPDTSAAGPRPPPRAVLGGHERTARSGEARTGAEDSQRDTEITLSGSPVPESIAIPLVVSSVATLPYASC